jgi:signal transduction histidine kinase
LSTEITSRSAVVAELGHAALIGVGVGELLDRACDLLCDTLDVEYAKVLHQPGGSDPLVLVAGAGWHDDVLIGHTTVPRGGDSQAGFTLQSESPVVVEDFSRDHRFSAPQLLVDHGVVSGMSVAVPDLERPYGVLGAHSRSPRSYAQEEIDFLRQVAGVLGGAIQNARTRVNLELRAHRQERQLRFPSAIADCAQALLASSGENRLELALEALQSATDATYIFVERNVLDPEFGLCSQTVVEVEKVGTPHAGSSNEYWDFVPWSRMPISRSHLERGESFLLIPDELTGVEREVYADDPFPIKSELDIPVFVDGEWAGLVGLADITTVRRWSDEEMSMLETVARMLGAFWEREAARRRLEELSSHKDRFVATVSHELRTPLTSVLGFVELLQEGGFDEADRQDILDLVSDEATDLVNLVEDLLTMARAGQESFRVAEVPVDLRAQMRQVLEALEDFRSDEFEIEGVAGRAAGDPARIRQILRNLVTNAIRYGGPSVVIVLSQQDTRWVQIAVVDDGEGIADVDRERVFEPYERAHHDPGKTESVGLGLAVSRTLARRMGGDLTYEYKDGYSRFVLRLRSWTETGDDGSSDSSE